MYCLILDEIDQLVTKEKDVLYAFFEWAKIPDSRLVLFGIANQLDLTTRFLPRLVTKNCEPEYLSFDPYKVNEISAIIKDRLQSLDDSPHTPSKKVDQNGKSILPVMQPMAVEMAARKLAGTGDLRKALDVCLQAIQLVETEAAKSENENAMVTVKHILTAATAMLGSPIINRMKELTLQAKLVLVAIVILIRNNKGQLTTFKVIIC
jgi:cell division control protein 6